MFDGHDPYPAVAVDSGWALVAHNRGAGLLMAGLPEELPAPPLNVLRASLHPDGLARRIVNLGEWKAHLMGRLARQVALSGDPALRTLHDELVVLASGAPEPESPALPRDDVVVALRLRSDAGELSFFSTVTTFGTPMDITVEELDRVVLPRRRAHGRGVGPCGRRLTFRAAMSDSATSEPGRTSSSSTTPPRAIPTVGSPPARRSRRSRTTGSARFLMAPARKDFEPYDG